MKTSMSRSRRLRNTHLHGEKQQETFFSQTAEQEQHPFFTPQNTRGQTVQAKLTIGKPNDRYEQEADQVANRVVARSGQTAHQATGTGAIQRASLMSPAEDEKMGTAEARMEKDKLIQEKIQKMAEQEEEPVQAKQEDEEVQTKQEDEEAQAKQEEEDIQAKQEDEEIQAKQEEDEEIQTKQEDEEIQAKQEEDEEIQAKQEEDEEIQAKQEDEEVQAKQEDEEVQAKAEGSSTASSNMSQQIKKSARAGKPLSGEVRMEMEQAFGADFSGVNIHTGAEAVHLNRQLRAQAFTHGKDIFFNEGKYRPETSAGKRLLVHELTHVIQQCGRGKPAHDNKKS